MEKNTKNLIYLLIVIFVVFGLCVAYKFIATELQKEKEISVINARPGTGEKTSSSSELRAVLPQKNYLEKEGYCGAGIEIDSAQAWIQACYLQDRLTKECKKSFNADGYLLIDAQNDLYSNGDIDAGTYLQKAKICNCELPTELAKELNDRMLYNQTNCKKLDLFKPQ